MLAWPELSGAKAEVEDRIMLRSRHPAGTRSVKTGLLTCLPAAGATPDGEPEAEAEVAGAPDGPAPAVAPGLPLARSSPQPASPAARAASSEPASSVSIRVLRRRPERDVVVTCPLVVGRSHDDRRGPGE